MAAVGARYLSNIVEVQIAVQSIAWLLISIPWLKVTKNSSRAIVYKVLIALSMTLFLCGLGLFSKNSNFIPISAVSFAPLGEELLFRGAMLPEKPEFKAIFFSAIVFSLFHFEPILMAFSFLAALMLTFARYHLGLFYCVLIHMGVNYFAFVTA